MEAIIFSVIGSTKQGAARKVMVRFIDLWDGRKEGNVLFCIRLYGDGHIVEDHSDSERFLFYMHHPTDRISHITAIVSPVVEHEMARDVSQWVHHEELIQRPIAVHKRTLCPRRYISLP